MAKGRKLKVYRTPIGFHDAYVATPSQKAALEAWGIDVNLFARGSAEEITDPQLMKEPLASPGVVFKRLRGTEEEQVAALGKKPSAKLRAQGQRRRAAKAKAVGKTRPRPPKPSRFEVSELEDAKKALDKKQSAELRELERREQELARERRSLERDQRGESSRIKKQLDRAREHYERALEEWHG